MIKWNAYNLEFVHLHQKIQKKFPIFITNQEEKVQTKKPLTLPQKYFNAFQNYFNNADEILVSYTYIPQYFKKTTSKNSKTMDNKDS